MNEEQEIPYPLAFENIHELESSVHYSDGLAFPEIPGSWSERYANELAAYFVMETPADSKARKKALTRHLGDRSWQKDSESNFFQTLHKKEAQTRKITPWTLSLLIKSEDDLYEGGYIDGTDLVRLRTELVRKIGKLENPGRQDLSDIGIRIATYFWSCRDFFSLDIVNPEKAQRYEQELRTRFGENIYLIQLIQEVIQNKGRSEYEPYVKQEVEKITHAVAAFYEEFVDQVLSPEEQDQLARVRMEASNVVFDRNQEKREKSFLDRFVRPFFAARSSKRSKQSQES